MGVCVTASASPFTADPVGDGSAIVWPHASGSSRRLYRMMILDGDRWVLGVTFSPWKGGHRVTPAFTRLPYFYVLRALCLCCCLGGGVEQFPKISNPCV